MFKKTSLLVIAVVSVVLLSACSKSSDIVSGKIPSIKVDVLSTSQDGKEVFTLVPITIYTGKTMTTNFIPVWHDIDYLSVKYKFENRTYVTKTDDFEIREYSGKPYAKIDKDDIGKDEAAVVLFTHD